MKRPLALLAGLALAAPLALGATAATAADPPAPVTVASGIPSPLKFSIELDGSFYVAESFAGSLSKIDRKGAKTTLYTSARGGGPENRSASVNGVSSFLGTVYFTETVALPPAAPNFPPENIESYLSKIDRSGKVTQLADIRAFENQNNPDSVNTYGFVGLTEECNAEFGEAGGSYSGYPDSNPFATLGTPVGTVIADAGANALFTVDFRGRMRTLAVFAPIPVRVTAEIAAAQGMPPCVVGSDYMLEPVPTDVELGLDGWLYVSLLPGGPEDGSVGANGAVVKVHPLKGTVVPVASGLAGATDVAVSPRGDVYVTQLFGGQVSVIKKGTSTAVPFRTVPEGAAIEWAPKGLYATSNVFAPAGGDLVLLPF